MLRNRLVALLVAATLAAGCTAVDDWSGLKRRKDSIPAPITDDGQLVAGYLSTLDRLSRGGTG